jgi:hypothetical protein
VTHAFTRSIAALFRSKADVATLRQLDREGIRTVSVLDFDQIEELVGQAIERELRESAAQGERSAASIVQGAQLEFLKLLGDDRRVEQKRDEFARQEAELASNLRELEAALGQKQVELGQRSEAVAQATLDELRAQLDASLAAAFLRSGKALSPEASAALASLQPALRESMLALLAAAITVKSKAPAAAGDEAELERLRRRITKLTAQLGETEQLLARARAERHEAEEGVASIYREAQGLATSAKDADLRKTLLREIFEHNRELRRTLGPPAAALTALPTSKELKPS